MSFSAKKSWPLLATLVLVVLTTLLVYYKDNDALDYSKLQLNANITQKTYDNYHEQVKVYAAKYKLPPEYLLALIALECSGRKIVPHRFEPHIYEKLTQITSGKLDRMENIKREQLKGLKVQDLRVLASSWGPFQIMGYKCFEINARVSDLKGQSSVDYGTKWIAGEYGDVLKKGDFKSAFHLHNTGRTYPKFGPPKTYHKEYVPRGLKYMEAFKVMLNPLEE